MSPVLGMRTFASPFELESRDGIIQLGRGGEVFPFCGPAVARCNPRDIDRYRSRVRITKLGPTWEEGVSDVLDEPHTSPDPRCTCGIFAYHDRGLTRGGRARNYRALYLVKGWGRVGWGVSAQWRAQYVEPIALSFAHAFEELGASTQRVATRIQENYDIPIIKHSQIQLFTELMGLSFEKPEVEAGEND